MVFNSTSAQKGYLCQGMVVEESIIVNKMRIKKVAEMVGGETDSLKAEWAWGQKQYKW